VCATSDCAASRSEAARIASNAWTSLRRGSVLVAALAEPPAHLSDAGASGLVEARAETGEHLAPRGLHGRALFGVRVEKRGACRRSTHSQSEL
jgi:hypothetical protein